MVDGKVGELVKLYCETVSKRLDFWEWELLMPRHAKPADSPIGERLGAASRVGFALVHLGDSESGTQVLYISKV